jgi:hypothetical protein
MQDIHMADGAMADGAAARDDPVDALLVEAAALRARPAYPAAVRQYSAGLVRFRQSSRLVNKLSAHEGRFRTIGYLLHLSAVSAIEGGDGGVSYGQLHEICVARHGEVSPRVLKTTLAFMRLLGFIESWRSAADRRVTVYRPTPRMLEFARRWFRHAAEALDVLAPEFGRLARLEDDPAFLDQLLVLGGRDHADGPPAERMPEFIGFFGGREGAAAITALLMLAAIDGQPMPSRAAMARQFGLSKTQVSEVITEGMRVGFLALDGASAPTMTARLRDSFRQWISIELAFYARNMRVA